ncbi:MAG: 2-hydroxyacyl-CoA dehydratase [Promethearchaeota archaeon]|nr:MAG: 2-hydroxyacyl-CoA dehydratase [Candidatus Lokiarchaeota archaeon]
MSIYADDVISFPSVLKMSYNFLMGRDYLKRKKARERKKLISVALGFPDLVYAVGGVPVFPIRLESFKLPALLALSSASSFLGWNLTSKVLDIARQFDILKLVDKILDEVINTINEKYNQMYEVGFKNNALKDLCYGINALYGMHESQGKNLDANLNFALRCGEWNYFSESMKTEDQIWVEIPPKNLENKEKAVEIMVDNIKTAIDQLEKLTGNVVSEESLKKQFRIGNQIKRYYKTILYEISNSNFYPSNPGTFAEILALLTITFQDYNSNAQRYLENMSQLVNEMRQRIKKGIGMDVSGMPKLLFTPMFSGWDPKVHEIIYELKGRIIYADWDIFGLLEEIPVTNKADPIENYAKFLLDASNTGLGCDKENLTSSYLKSAKELKVDGMIFNQVFGCPSISNIYDSIRESINEELEIPATVINFKKIGDNIGEVRESLGNFIKKF